MLSSPMGEGDLNIVEFHLRSWRYWVIFNE